MKRTTKSILALVVLVAMCVSFCVPTFAAASDELNLLAAAKCPGKTANGETITHNKDNCEFVPVGEYVEPICGEYGYQTYQCTTCGAHFASGRWDAEKQEIVGSIDASMLNNKHDVPTTEATCTEAGYRKGFCTICNKEVDETIPAKGHKLETVVTGTSCIDGITTTQVCKVCGETVGEPVKTEPTAHNWKVDGSINESAAGKKDGDGLLVKPTCDGSVVGKVQFVCGNANCTATMVADYTGTAAHTWNPYQVLKAPTCSEAGVARGYCTVCGIEKNDIPVAQLPHAEYVTQAAVPATCTEAGLTAGLVCKECKAYHTDATKAPKVIPALGHTKGTILAHVDPQCELAGSETFICKTCNEVVTAPIAALGHNISTTPVEVKNPTCTEFGYEIYCCLTCGKKNPENGGLVTLPALGHNKVAIESRCVEATCQAPGKMVYECLPKMENGVLVHPGCVDANGDPTIIEEVLPQLDHGYVYTTILPKCLGGNQYSIGYDCFMCQFCGEIQDGTICNYVQIYTGTLADADKKEGYTYYNLAEMSLEDKKTIIEHPFGEFVTLENGCTTTGKLLHFCPQCQINWETVIPAAHKWQDVAGAELKFHCEQGFLKLQECVRGTCDAEQYVPVVENYANARNHDFTSAKATKVVVPATCTTAGYTYYVCGNTCDLNGKTYNCIAESAPSEPVNALGHDLQKVLYPNCVEGIVTYKMECTRCTEKVENEAYVEEFDITNPAHHTDNTKVFEIIHTTCYTNDITWYTCMDCTGLVPATADDIQANNWPANVQHKGIFYIVEKEYTHYKNYEEFIDNTKKVIAAIAPTCYSLGYTAGYYCLSCQAQGKALEDCWVNPAPIAMIPHVTENVAYKAPTCTDKGNTAGVQCTDPNCTYKTWEDVAATGHTDVAVPGFAATCTTPGQKDAFYCSVCGNNQKLYVYDDNHNAVYNVVIPALGHSYTDVVRDKNECERVDFVFTYCTRFGCSAYEFESFDFGLGHQTFDRTNKPSGMTAEEFAEIVEKLGKLDLDATCASDGWVAHVCYRATCDGVTNQYGFEKHYWTAPIFKTGEYHENKDGVKFDDECVDAEGKLVNVEDRYCVICKQTVAIRHNTETVYQEATCMHPEYIFEICTEEACGYKDVLYKGADAEGHKYEEVSIKTPTLFEAGIKVERCKYYSECGEQKPGQTPYYMSGIQFNYALNTAAYVDGALSVTNKTHFVNSGLVAVTITANASKFDFSTLFLSYNYDATVLTFVSAEFVPGTEDKGFDVEVTDANKAYNNAVNGIGTVTIGAEHTDGTNLTNTEWHTIGADGKDAGAMTVAVLYFYINVNVDKNTQINIATNTGSAIGACSISKVDEAATDADKKNVPVTENVTFAKNASDVLGDAKTTALLGDLDGDGKINSNDTNYLLAIFFSDAEKYKAEADIDKNGIVDLDDYRALKACATLNETYVDMAEAAFLPMLNVIREKA